MKNIVLLAGLVIGFLVAAATAQDKVTWEKITKENYNKLVDHKWHFVKADKAEFKNTTGVSLAFDAKNRVSGRSFVNRYFGGIAFQEDGSVKIGPLASSRMGGDRERMQQESSYLKLMGQAKTLHLSSLGNLKVEGEADVLHFSKVAVGKD